MPANISGAGEKRGIKNPHEKSEVEGGERIEKKALASIWSGSSSSMTSLSDHTFTVGFAKDPLKHLFPTRFLDLNRLQESALEDEKQYKKERAEKKGSIEQEKLDHAIDRQNKIPREFQI